MASAVTIDNYNVGAHKRYADDQIAYDPSLLQETGDIAANSSVANGKERLLTKWEELFETHLQNHPFATFTPPPFFSKMRKRIFAHVLSPEFDWTEDDEKEERRYAEKYRKMIKEKKARHMPLALFEKDKTAVLNLIDSIETLNGFLKEINARKLQYQKG